VISGCRDTLCEQLLDCLPLSALSPREPPKVFRSPTHSPTAEYFLPAASRTEILSNNLTPHLQLKSGSFEQRGWVAGLSHINRATFTSGRRGARMTQFQITQNRTTPNPLPGFLLTIAFRAGNAKRKIVLQSFRKSHNKPRSHWTLPQKVRGQKTNKLRGGAKMQRSSCSSFRTLSRVEGEGICFRSPMYEAGYLLSNQAFRQSRRYIPSKTGLLRLFSRACFINTVSG
jgi:hypothetical protein